MPGPERKTHPIREEPRAVADDPLERIAAIKGVQAYWERELSESVKDARRQGYSWREIATALGVSYQAVLQRFKDI